MIEIVIGIAMVFILGYLVGEHEIASKAEKAIEEVRKSALQGFSELLKATTEELEKIAKETRDPEEFQIRILQLAEGLRELRVEVTDK